MAVDSSGRTADGHVMRTVGPAATAEAARDGDDAGQAEQERDDGQREPAHGDLTTAGDHDGPARDAAASGVRGQRSDHRPGSRHTSTDRPTIPAPMGASWHR